jgi:hypothetical protein
LITGGLPADDLALLDEMAARPRRREAGADLARHHAGVVQASHATGLAPAE